MVRCFGPDASAVMNGRLISVCVEDDSSFLAFSALFFEALQRQLIVAQINTVFFLKLIGQIADELHVEVFTTKERVAVGRFDFENTVTDLQNGDIEGAAAKVVDRDGAGLILFVETVSERRRGRFVDYAQTLRGPQSCRRPWSPGAGHH